MNTYTIKVNMLSIYEVTVNAKDEEEAFERVYEELHEHWPEDEYIDSVELLDWERGVEER